MRRLVLALALLTLAPAGAQAAPLPRIDVAPEQDGRRALVTADGREVLLRGINVNQLGDYYADDPAKPTTIALRDADFAHIRALGFDVVRLIMSWSAFQPAPGSFDEAYLARVREAVRSAERHDLHVVLDMHQDAWGKFIATPKGAACEPGFGPSVGWDGAPLWATLTDGTSTCRAADTRELSPAVAQAFTNFYADREGIQGELVATWARIARAFAGDTTVAGFDLFNEPHPGYLIGAAESAALGAFYGRTIDAVRAAEAAVPGGFPHVIFYEPSVLWSGFGADSVPPPGFTADRRIAFSPHIYTESITVDRKTGLTAVSIEDGWRAARETARASGAALWSGEWGWFGEPAQDAAKLRRYAAQEDAALAGGAWWVWRQACGDPHVVGAGALSGSLNRYGCPGDRPLGQAREFTSVLSRAFPRYAPGRLTALVSDPATGRFDVRGVAPASGAAPSGAAGGGRAAGPSCAIELWVPGSAPPELAGESVSTLDATAIAGGWRVTGCARGTYRVTGRANGLPPATGLAPDPSTVAPTSGPGSRAPRRCTSRRSIVVTLRAARGRVLRRVVVRVGTARPRVLRGDRTRVRVSLRGRPRGTVVVRLTATDRRGRRFEERRVFRTCAGRR